jgi:hypothetical protein
VKADAGNGPTALYSAVEHSGSIPGGGFIRMT